MKPTTEELTAMATKFDEILADKRYDWPKGEIMVRDFLALMEATREFLLKDERYYHNLIIGKSRET